MRISIYLSPYYAHNEAALWRLTIINRFLLWCDLESITAKLYHVTLVTWQMRRESALSHQRSCSAPQIQEATFWVDYCWAYAIQFGVGLDSRGASYLNKNGRMLSLKLVASSGRRLETAQVELGSLVCSLELNYNILIWCISLNVAWPPASTFDLSGTVIVGFIIIIGLVRSTAGRRPPIDLQPLLLLWHIYFLCFLTRRQNMDNYYREWQNLKAIAAKFYA